MQTNKNTGEREAVENKGINYAGPGSTTNMNPDTGIRYGVIPANDCSPDAMEDVWSNGTDCDYRDYIDTVKQGLRSALSDYFSDTKWGNEKASKLDDAVESAFDAISDGLSDGYTSGGDCTRMLYEKDGYKIQTDSSGDVWVLASPYFTYAQFCSPCAPGACHLRNPLSQPDESNKCYCLGSDWFDDSKAPYPVYSVATGERL